MSPDMARCSLGPSCPLLRTTESASDTHMLRDSRWVWDDPMRMFSCILPPRHRLLFVENYTQDRWIFFSSTESHWGVKFKISPCQITCSAVGLCGPICSFLPLPSSSVRLLCPQSLAWVGVDLRTWVPDAVILEAAAQQALVGAPPSPERKVLSGRKGLS